MRKRGKGGPRQPSRQISIPKIYRFSPGLEQQFKMLPHDYLTQLSQGDIQVNQYLTLVLRIFTGLGMAEHMSQESKAQCLHVLYYAMEALTSIGGRYRRLGRFGLSGDELQDLREGLNLVDALQDATTRKEQASTYQPFGDKVGSLDQAMAALAQYEQQYRVYAGPAA